MNYADRYRDFLRGFVKNSGPVSVVLDASNGSAGPVLDGLFTDTPVDAHAINTNPDGEFPAHGPDPIAPGALDEAKRKIGETGADFGVVFDGDGDRAVFLDEKGQKIDTVDVFFLLKPMFSGPYVANLTVLSKFIMPDENVIETKTGIPFIRQAMMEHDAGFGIERSGHYYFRDFFHSDSCLFATIAMVNKVSQLKEKGKTLSDEVRTLPKFCFPEEENFEATNAEEAIKKVKEHYDKRGFTTYLLDGVSVIGRDFALNVRPSNTEPLVRLNVVAREEEPVARETKAVKLLLRENETNRSMGQ